jgi:hypothetical protein
VLGVQENDRVEHNAEDGEHVALKHLLRVRLLQRRFQEGREPGRRRPLQDGGRRGCQGRWCQRRFLYMPPTSPAPYPFRDCLHPFYGFVDGPVRRVERLDNCLEQRAGEKG